jgi:hypothetical protein
LTGFGLKMLLLGAAFVSLTACATTREEFLDWKAHPTHFASGDHFSFSVNNRHAPPVVAKPTDMDRSRGEAWWGDPIADPPPADVAGRWIGTWSGYDPYQWPWSGRARAEFAQNGTRGAGRLVLADTLTMDVPQIITLEGSRGVQVVLQIIGSVIIVRHEDGGQLLTGVFTVDGDRMVGRFRNSSAQLVLTRQR